MTEIVAQEAEILAVGGIEEHLQRALRSWCLECSEHTRRARRTDLLHFAAHAGLQTDEPWRAVLLLVQDGPVAAREAVVAWLETQEREGRAATTRARRCSTLRSLVAHLQSIEPPLRWGLRVKPPRWDPYDNARGPTREAVEAVARELAEVGRDRDLAILLLLYDCGLRRSEVAGIRCVDWDDLGPSVRITRKGGRSVRRTTSRRCADAIERWMGSAHLVRSSNGPLFPGRSGRGLSPHRISQLTRELGLGGAHGLRHTSATMLVEATANPYLVRAHLGHRNVATSQTYVDQVRDEAGAASRIIAGEQQ